MMKQRGDTIIEVLFATTIFSLIAVGGLSLMNQGTAMAQRALEIGLVRQQVDAQADALRYLNRAYIADYGKRGAATTSWNEVIGANAVGSAVNFNDIVINGKCQLPASNGRPFALDIEKLSANPLLAPNAEAATYAKVRYDTSPVSAEGIWIQAVRSNGDDTKPGFYDFHIRACWQSPGQQAPMTIGTIVRLYEPRG
jgi:type II secretory pathway pseudopilin PulG